MGKVGRPRIFTPEEQKEKQKKHYEKYRDKRVNDPELQVRQQLSKSKYESNKTPEQKQRDREYNTAYQNRRREMLRQLKENQMKVACEQAEEL